MADKTIGSLPAASDLNDDSLLIAEQQGQAVSVPGSLFKGFARAVVSQYVGLAKEYSEAAKKSAGDAADSLSQIGDSVTQATKSAASAIRAASDAQTAKEGAEAAMSTVEQAKTDAQTASEAAQDALNGAEAAKKDAQTAAAQTAKDKADAEAARTASEEAQVSAETARAAAETANTSAAKKAAEAAASAAAAQQYSGKPPIIQDGTWWTWNADDGAYQDTGKRSVLGYDKSYPSVEEMEADKSQPAMTTAVIASSVEDEDNAKLYIFDGTNWNYLTDLSGFTGVGVEDIQLTSGNHAPGTTDVYTITLTDGRMKEITVYNGTDGSGAGDMLAGVYDPSGKREDIFAYTDKKYKEIFDRLAELEKKIENAYLVLPEGD